MTEVMTTALGPDPRLVVKGGGTIWFTSPSHGYLLGFRGDR